MKHSQLISTICFLFIVLWVYAAFSKLSQFDTFKMQLAAQPLPDWSTSTLTWLLPTIEILGAGLLCFQKTIGTGLLVSLLLMASFTLYVGLVLSQVLGNLPCACGGLFSALKWPGHFIFNIVFTAIAATGYYLHRKKPTRYNYLDINRSRVTETIE